MLALAIPQTVLLVVLAVILIGVIATFNHLVRLRNKVNESFAGIDVQLKRRHDLVPNLVKVVKAYAKHEQDTLEEVVQARGEASAAEAMAERERSENGLTHSLGKLIALVERYPELKADGNFRKLHHDLVEIENDLQYARRYYNGTVRDLNTKVEQFPSSLIAGMTGVRKRAFFEIEEPATRSTPRVDLDA